MSTENQWRAAVDGATESELELLAGHVRAAEIQRDRERTVDEEFDRAREARDAAMTDHEQAETNQWLLEAAARAQEADQPATRGQMSELLAVMREVRDALTKR